MSSGRDAMGLSFMGDRLFIVGGFDGQSYLNCVEAYDPLTNEWQQVIDVSFSLYLSFHVFVYIVSVSITIYINQSVSNTLIQISR